MKKLLFLAVALIMVATGANAQSKAVNDAVKAMNKAKAEAENPKKSGLAATWVKLANAYMAVYDAPTEGILVPAPKFQTDLALKGQPALSAEQVEIGGKLFNAVSYVDKVLYYDETETLVAYVVTKSVVENPLQLAYEAVSKAVELDEKKAQTKAISEIFAALKQKYDQAGRMDVTVSRYPEASVNFENAMNVAAHPFVGQVDSTMAYYTAYTATFAKDHSRAIKFFEYCQSIGYEMNGDVASYLAAEYKAVGDTAKCVDILTAGFAKYPTNNYILGDLISVYFETNEDPVKVLELVKSAQANDPNSAILVYVEGEALKSLGRLEDAIAAFHKAGEIDANYIYAPFNEGAAYYDLAVKLDNEAQAELDDNKYMALKEKVDASLKGAIEPFERAFNIAAANESMKDIQVACAEYLKNIFFRFRDEDPSFQASYEKYNQFAADNK